jgi:ribosomal protein S18 acetylase RimI-like enzyme
MLPEQIIIADLTITAHAQATVELLNEYAQDEMGGGQALPDYVQANLVKELIKRQGAHVILALVDEAPVGLIICLEGFSTFSCKPLLNIHDVIVSPAFRGRGISKRMLAKAEEIALEKGCCKLTLEVLEGNAVAKAAYQASGYEGYELNPIMGKALFWQKKL